MIAFPASSAFLKKPDGEGLGGTKTITLPPSSSLFSLLHLPAACAIESRPVNAR